MDESFAGVPIGVMDLRQVVILGRQPEDGNRFGAAACCFLGDADRRDRFVKRVRGAGKKSGLLAGDDGHGPTGETIKIPVRRRVEFPAGAKFLVLLAENFADLAADI